MIHRTVCSIVTIMLACPPATAANRRVGYGLDTNNKAIVLFDSRMTLSPGKSGIPQTNLWMTDASPAGFSFNDDSGAKPIGLSPPDNGTKITVVEVPRSTPPREGEDGAQSDDEGGRRSRADQGASREASDDASHSNG